MKKNRFTEEQIAFVLRLADAIERSAEGCLINLFAGIPVDVRQDLDLDTYIANRCFMFGTSGSVIEDMKIVLRKVTEGSLDPECIVDAIAGMAGAIKGLRPSSSHPPAPQTLS